MTILYIAGINDNKSAGPNINIPQNVFYGSKYANIGIYNCYTTTNNKILDYKNYFSKEEMKGFDIKTLPKPFDNPDLVIFEEVYRIEYAQIAKKLVKCNIPYIITPRGSMTFHSQQRKRAKKIIGNILFFNEFIRNALAIHFLTENECMESNKFKFKNYFIVGNGVEKKKKLKKFETIHEEFIVTFIGRIAMYHKGLDFLIEAVNLGQYEFRKNKFKFSLYGPDDLNSISKLKDLIKDYDISDLVSINNPVHDKEKENVILNSDLFIHTSRLEGQPTAVMEAISYGLPVFVTPGTNIDKLVEKNNLGFVSELAAEAIKEKLLHAYEQREKFSKMSKNAVVFSENNLDWNIIMKQTIENCKQMLQK